MNAVTEEVFTVGSVVGDDWDTFGSVQAVGFDERANLHILDSQSARVLVVGPDGSLIRTVGGQGEGPGEFNSPGGLIVARDGSYTVTGLAQIDLLNPGGEFVRRITMDPMTTAVLRADLALPDGRLVTPMILRIGADEEAGEGRPIYALPLDGAAVQVLYTAWELPGEDEDLVDSESSSAGMVMRMSAGRAFEPPLALDMLTDGRLALVDSIGYRIKLIASDGRVTGTVERPIAPLPVDERIMEAERERYRETTASLLESGRRANLSFPVQFEREGAEELAFADEVPVIAGIKVDWEDRIWVERRGPTGDDDGPTDIVTPGGGYIGTLPPEGIQTPNAFGPGGLMAYIETDELDVQTVRVIRLVALEPEG
ncbi:hypothetical protein [Candidatus Palauibacter sp.]|uniref:hypothetical protein n=1 Tax=Candidatus Palauibacter sp. TaxID=3101350 RepID=UPI003B52858B